MSRPKPGYFDGMARPTLLARAILSMAVSGGLPDSYWESDSRVLLACRVLGIQPGVEARKVGEEQNDGDA